MAIHLDRETERKLQGFYATLSEKDQRRFAAIEATQRGHGGIKYAPQVLGCSARTIERGIAELDDLPNDPARDESGGQAPVGKKIAADSPAEQNLNALLNTRTAGAPDDE